MTKLEQILNDTLTEWGWEDVVVLDRNDFAYYESLNLITISTEVPKEHEIMFEQLFEELDCQYQCSNFIYSFLHELGHHETLYLLTDKEIKKTEKIMRKKHTIMNLYKYYRSPREIIATQWAADYINDNIEKIIKLNNMLNSLE